MNAAVNAGILERHVLTTSFDRQLAAEKNLPLDGYDVILANPPFSGRLGRDRIVDDVKISASTATELLFVKYMIDNLKGGGRCGVVVPEGVLSNSRVAHKELRRMLMENNRVEAMLSLPGGVFQPYSGVKTSVLIFGQCGRTERVMFLHASNDGFKLDANHEQSRRSARPDRRLQQPRRTVRPIGESAMHRRRGRKTGGLQTPVPSSARAGICPRRATGRKAARRRFIAIRASSWKNCRRTSV